MGLGGSTRGHDGTVSLREPRKARAQLRQSLTVSPRLKPVLLGARKQRCPPNAQQFVEDLGMQDHPGGSFREGPGSSPVSRLPPHRAGPLLFLPDGAKCGPVKSEHLWTLKAPPVPACCLSHFSSAPTPLPSRRGVCRPPGPVLPRRLLAHLAHRREETSQQTQRSRTQPSGLPVPQPRGCLCYGLSQALLTVGLRTRRSPGHPVTWSPRRAATQPCGVKASSHRVQGARPPEHRPRWAAWVGTG